MAGKSFLDRSSLEVRKVTDNAVALATVALWQPHLIVFRADPSGEEAWRFCHTLKTEPRGTLMPKLLMVTDQVLLAQQQAFETAYDAHLISPVDVEQLLYTMAEILNIPRRVRPRVPLDVLVHTEGFAEPGLTVDAMLANSLTVSEDGMLLEAGRQLSRGTRGRVQFFLPGSEERITLQATVHAAVDEVRLIYVMEFVDLQPQHRALIRRHVAGQVAGNKEVT